MSDGKGIVGKGRLSNKIINTMPNYYGMAIVQPPSHHRTMIKKKPCKAWKTLWHCPDMPDNQERHAIYLRESKSLCKHCQNGGSEDYKSSVNLRWQLIIPMLRGDNTKSKWSL